MEKHKLEHTEIIINTHDSDICIGEYCTIHNRSNHSMRSFPQEWRSDWGGFMERICPHGVGHPDPDDPKSKDKYEAVHGCDGCCMKVNKINPSFDGEN